MLTQISIQIFQTQSDILYYKFSGIWKGTEETILSFFHFISFNPMDFGYCRITQKWTHDQ